MDDLNVIAELRKIQDGLRRIEDRLTGQHYSPVRRCAVCLEATPNDGREICEQCLQQGWTEEAKNDLP